MSISARFANIVLAGLAGIAAYGAYENNINPTHWKWYVVVGALFLVSTILDKKVLDSFLSLNVSLILFVVFGGEPEFQHMGVRVIYVLAVVFLSFNNYDNYSKYKGK